MSELLAGAFTGLGEGIIQAARIQKQEALRKRKELERRYVLEARLSDPESTKAQKRSARHQLEAMARLAGETGMGGGGRAASPGRPRQADTSGGSTQKAGLGRRPQSSAPAEPRQSVRDEWLNQDGPPRKTRNQIRREREKRGLGRKPGAADQSAVDADTMQQADGSVPKDAAPKSVRRRSAGRDGKEAQADPTPRERTEDTAGREPDPDDPGIFAQIDAAIREAIPYKLEVGATGIRVVPLEEEEGDPKPAKKKGADSASPAGGVARPKTAAEYEALPAGTRYLHPDGTVKVKK